MEIRLTPADAWKDFYQWMKARKKAGELKRIPADVQEAQYASQPGKRKYGLGNQRIASLLKKYGADRYQVELTFIKLKE